VSIPTAAPATTSARDGRAGKRDALQAIGSFPNRWFLCSAGWCGLLDRKTVEIG
jgi:hypothetical protein